MKKIITKIAILILIILFLPYVITIFFHDAKESNNYITEQSNENMITTMNQNFSEEESSIIYKENGKEVVLNLDNYIMGALAVNIPAQYELETLKAQAVIIRTYALKSIENIENIDNIEDIDNIVNGGNKSLTTSEIGLPYKNIEEMKETWGDKFESNYKKIENAVYATKNEVITYNKDLIEPLFHEVSVGKTRSSLEAFGEERPYLINVDSSLDVTSSDYMKITEDTTGNVMERIKTKYEKVDISKEEFFDEVLVTSRDSLGFVKEIRIGSLTLTGEEFASMMKLNSSNFYIENYEGNVRFICKGKGHGVGLSQFGANEMAKKNKSYKEILNHYYTNTNIFIFNNE